MREGGQEGGFCQKEGKAQRFSPLPIGPSALLWPRPKARARIAHILATQVLSTRILAMKASLCKLSPCTVTRVCDYHAKLFLIAISSTLKSLLRPHVLNTPDKSPGDRLTEICAKITDVGGSSSILQATLGTAPTLQVPSLSAREDPSGVSHVPPSPHHCPWGHMVGVTRNKDEAAWVASLGALYVWAPGGWRELQAVLHGVQGALGVLKPCGGYPELLPPALPSRGPLCEVPAFLDCLSPPRH